MPHRTNQDIRENRATWTGPVSAGQRRHINQLLKSLSTAWADDEKRDLTFQEAGHLIEDLTAVVHQLTHRANDPDGLGPVAAAAEMVERATKRREGAIVRASTAGYSLRKTADRAGLSHQSISNIIGRS